MVGQCPLLYEQHVGRGQRQDSGEASKESVPGRPICSSEDAELGKIAKYKKPVAYRTTFLKKCGSEIANDITNNHLLSLPIQSDLFSTFNSIPSVQKRKGTGQTRTEKPLNAVEVTLRTNLVWLQIRPRRRAFH